MSQYKMMLVDAFTQQALGGNPCAVLFDTDHMDEQTMQAVALEMNQSETAFVQSSEKADFRVRYFTPGEEIPLAGHPTIATTFALIHSGRFPMTGTDGVLHLEMQVGVIRVEISKQGKHIVMFQQKPEFHEVVPKKEVAQALGLSLDAFLPDAPLQIISTGTPMLMVPLKDHTHLRSATIHTPAYLELKERYDFFSPHLFCLQGATSEGDTFARHLCLPPDPVEDPFTGSATGCMGAYLWHYQFLKKSSFTAQQGHWMGRPGQCRVEVVGSPGDIETVKVGGSAVVVVEGVITL